LHVITNGRGRGHPGPGGCAFLSCDVETQARGPERVEADAARPTTHHRMAFEAVIQDLAAWRAPGRVERSPNSEDVLMWLNGGRARTHHDVVARLFVAAAAPITVSRDDVRGHAAHLDHTGVDAFAQQAASTGVRRARRRGLTCHRTATWPVALVCTDARSGLGTRMAS
jgi:ribonuclease HI